MKLKAWLERNLFPLALSAVVVAFEAGFFLFVLKATPPGMRWLGAYMGFPGDIAVYLDYLRQGSQGRIMLDNLFAVEPHALRFDPYWSTLGLFARTGINPALLHEISRWVMSVFLVFSLHTCATYVTKNNRDRRLATVLAVLIPGLGWTYSIWMTKFGVWEWASMAAADVVYEFAVAPILLAGSHMILSMALLMLALLLGWQAWSTKNLRRAGLATLCSAGLLSFHPYFAPLIMVYWLALWIMQRPSLDSKILLKLTATQSLAFVPMAVTYLPLVFDRTFTTHHLQANILPLPPLLTWVGTLTPFLIALSWRWWRKDKIQTQEKWLIIWILAAIICMLSPLPWKRKYLEGLGPALVWLTLPFWSWLRDRILAGTKGCAQLLAGGMLLFAAGLNVFHLLTSEMSWINDPIRAKWFYRPNETFAAWEYLSQADSESVILADDLWINVWTPAYTVRRVWVAHDHETPDFEAKAARWREFITTDNAESAKKFLDTAGVTHLMLTSSSSTRHFEDLLQGTDWRPTFNRGQVTVLERR